MTSRRLPRAVDRTHDLADIDGLQIDVAVDFQLRIDRDHVIDAAEFDAVAGIIDHRPIGRIGDAGELAQRPDLPSRSRSVLTMTVWKPAARKVWASNCASLFGFCSADAKR